MSQSWIVRVVEIEKDKLVVDLGGGHLVDLVGIMDKINLQKTIDGATTVASFRDTVNWGGWDGAMFKRQQAAREGNMFCVLPLTQVNRGGRPTKSHRPRPRHHRATRRATRRR